MTDNTNPRPRIHESQPSWMQHARDLGDYDISLASYGGIEIEPVFEEPESLSSCRVGDWVRSEAAGKRIEELVGRVADAEKRAGQFKDACEVLMNGLLDMLADEPRLALQKAVRSALGHKETDHD